MSGALVVFAKAPRPGEVKTRLCPPFELEEAAALYTAMLDDVLETSGSAARALGLSAWLAVTPPEAERELAARAAADGFRSLAQRGRDLGARIEHALADLAARGFGPLLVRGSDSPAMTADAMGRALAALGSADLALAPDPDGGYGLVALRRPVPGLFTHEMSTAQVLEETSARARAAGLRVSQLEPGFDIDVAADLERLAEARAGRPALPCPRTLAWLDRHDGWRRAAQPS